LSLQLIVRKKDFSEDFLAKSRAAALAGYDRAMGAVGNAEKDIPEKHWIEISDEDRARYDQMFLDVRVELRDNKVYDGNALRLMRQARCKKDATRAECAQPRE
ncbi:MAG: hypothetical protein KC620_06350, partial [Myxococcales bacterium]|nr:hypothetical protein [Myxococcales bacterium]